MAYADRHPSEGQSNHDDVHGPGQGTSAPAANGAADEETPLLPVQEGSVNDRGGFAGLWRRIKSPRRDRVASILLLVFSALLFLVALLVLLYVYRSKTMNSTALCLTPACIHAASEFLYNLSPRYQELDACTDFEELVCGGWRSRHNLRSDQGQSNALSLMSENAENILRSILDGVYLDESQHSAFSPRQLGDDPKTIDKANFEEIQRAYNACMAIDNIRQVGAKPLQVVLNDLSETFSDPSDLSASILFLERLGVPHLESLSPGADDKDPNVVVINAFPRTAPGLSSKAYYTDDAVMAAYRDAMGKVLGAILPNVTGNGTALAKGVVDFEKKVAAITPSLDNLRDVTLTYNEMSLADTAARAPQLGLDKVLKALVPSNYTIDRMITAFPTFLGNVSQILKDTPGDTVKNFLYWKVIQSFSGSIEGPEIRPYIQFTNKLAGRDPDAVTERYRTCLANVDTSLGWILSRFYVEAAFSANAKDLGNQVILDIKDQFINRITGADWMDDEAKTVAKSKVTNIVQKIGYPEQSPNITNPISLEAYYSSLNVTDKFFDNVVQVRIFGENQSWSQLGKPTDKSEWGMTASTINAYFNPPYNEIVFPAGIMQFPLFGEGLPGYINYAGFGAVAGHELSHAFDNNGRLYDLNGYLKDWWSNQTVQEFQKRADCFVEEYNNFTVVGTNGTINVNGKQTLGENIADAGGLSAAFSAWQARKAAAPEPNLPGLDFFTQEQLFYVAFGNVWCSKYTPQALTQRVIGDEHSPNMWRVKGTAMMNSVGFRQAYNCPVKEPVCQIW